MAPSYNYQKVSDSDTHEELEVENDPPAYNDSHQGYPHYDFSQRAWFQRPSVFWLLPVFLLFNLGMGATTMPKMNVVTSLLCRKIRASNPTSMQHEPRHQGSSMSSMEGMAQNHTSSTVIIGEHNPQCSIDTVESATSMLMLYGNLIAGILGAITAPFWGKLSDRYGRVKLLAAASTIILGSETIVVLIAKLPDAFPLNWIYIAWILEGMSGTFILIMALASSYAADCSTDSGRNVALGWFHGSMFFGFAAGPVLGGFLGMSDGQSRPMLIFYVSLAMRVLGIAFLMVFVPESLTAQAKVSAFDPSQMKDNLSKAVQQTWTERMKNVNFLQILTSNAGMNRKTRRNLIALASINTIMFGAFMGAMNVMLLYSEYVFGWGNKESGVFLSTVNFFRTLATMLVLPLAVRFLRRYFYSGPAMSGKHASGFDRLDLFLIRISILSDVVGYIGYAVASSGFLFTLSGALAALGAVGLATSEASMTKLVGSARTGELLGALGFLQALARIVAPTVANATYSLTVAKAPQLVFWGVAACFVAAGSVTFWATPTVDRRTNGGEEEVPLHAVGEM